MSRRWTACTVAAAGLATLPGLAAAFAAAGPAGDRRVLLVAAGVGGVLLGWLLAVARGVCRPPSGALILAAALILRLSAAAGPVRFDDDLWRYLWDGGATAVAVSPYEFAPLEVLEVDAELDPLLYGPEGLARLDRLRREAADRPRLGSALERINFPQFPTIYPPASQLAFSAAAAVAPGSDRAWRLVTALADGCVVWCLLGLLRALGKPRWWAAAYGLHPLPALEFASAGHQDALGIACLVGAAWALGVRRSGARRIGAGGLLAVAGGIKLFPLLLSVAWWRELGWRGWAGVLAVAFGLALPFAFLGPVDFAGLMVYSRRWEFFSGPYALMTVPASVFAMADSTTRVIGLVLVGLGIALTALWTRPWRIGLPVRRVVGRGLLWVEALVVLSPVVNPWYVPWAMAAGAVRGSLAWPVFGLLVPLAYVPFTGAAHPGWLRALAWLPLLCLLAAELWIARRHSGSTAPRVERRRERERKP